jgi:hypothetical protein
MDTLVTVAIISASAAIIAAPATFFITKYKEREAEWRRYKFEFYKELVQSLSGTVGTDSTADGQRRFASACNTLCLIASKSALDALNAFRDEIRTSNPNRSVDRHDVLLSQMVWHIREDLGIPDNASIEDFKAQLWTSGNAPGN